MKLLITGFDPFGGEAINPAWEAVKALPDRIGEWEVTRLQIPTVFSLAAAEVLRTAQALMPDAIICVGQAGGRNAITPERIAVNIRDAKIPDNRGNRPAGDFVDPEGPAAYFSTVDVKAMVRSIEAEGIPAAVSNSAGAFVCNDVLYTLLHFYRDQNVRVGFIHVPYLPQQAKEGVPSLELDTIIRGLTAAIGAL